LTFLGGDPCFFRRRRAGQTETAASNGFNAWWAYRSLMPQKKAGAGFFTQRLVDLSLAPQHPEVSRPPYDLNSLTRRHQWFWR
jgi:hypothetical protein